MSIRKVLSSSLNALNIPVCVQNLFFIKLTIYYCCNQELKLILRNKYRGSLINTEKLFVSPFKGRTPSDFEREKQIEDSIDWSLFIQHQLSWLGVNLYLFIDTFCWYEEEESFLYTRVILGVSRVGDYTLLFWKTFHLSQLPYSYCISLVSLYMNSQHWLGREHLQCA